MIVFERGFKPPTSLLAFSAAVMSVDPILLLVCDRLRFNRLNGVVEESERSKMPADDPPLDPFPILSCILAALSGCGKRNASIGSTSALSSKRRDTVRTTVRSTPLLLASVFSPSFSSVFGLRSTISLSIIRTSSACAESAAARRTNSLSAHGNSAPIRIAD